MKNLVCKIILCQIIFAFYSTIFAQTKETKSKTPTNQENVVKEKGQFSSQYEESQYYAPIRYAIIYNDIWEPLNERRITILLDEKNFSKENLTVLFKHIAKKYPDPYKLEVSIHTNLATIETPEEKLMIINYEESRFENVTSEFMNASFHRFENGLEAFSFTKSLHPENYERVVINQSKD